MLSKLQKLRTEKSSQQGFTIIEVMIVLAIAGLIILIVLLAVPALQRNGRNTAIKNDASAITAGISEFASNNDGSLPLKANSDATTAGTVILKNAGGTEATAKVQSSTVVTIQTDGTVAVVTPKAGELTVTFKTKCPATVTGTTVTPLANNRSSTVIYAIETASATTAKCLDS